VKQCVYTLRIVLFLLPHYSRINQWIVIWLWTVGGLRHSCIISVLLYFEWYLFRVLENSDDDNVNSVSILQRVLIGACMSGSPHVAVVRRPERIYFGSGRLYFGPETFNFVNVCLGTVSRHRTNRYYCTFIRGAMLIEENGVRCTTEGERFRVGDVCRFHYLWTRHFGPRADNFAVI